MSAFRGGHCGKDHRTLMDVAWYIRLIYEGAYTLFDILTAAVLIGQSIRVGPKDHRCNINSRQISEHVFKGFQY